MLITTMLLTFNSFGQKFFNDLSVIESSKGGKITVEDWIQNDLDFEPSWIYEVNFVKDGKLYMLAYEPTKGNRGYFTGKQRSVFLYVKDLSNKKNPWIIASDTVFVAKFIDGHNYTDINFMKKDYASGCFGEYAIEKDCIKITVGYDQLVNGKFYTKPITFIFTPKSSNFYNVKQ